jgi:pimeloyl-ACP methyl ester carboxylesterase
MRVWTRLLPALLLVVGSPVAILVAQAQTVRVVMEEFTVPATDDPAVRLYVRNKRPEGLSEFRADRTLLYVHGATYPAHTAFDLQLDGLSWMDFIARRGFDVYLVDLRGYGKSTRPKVMDEPAEQNEPIVTTPVARRDVGAVVDHILQRRNLSKLNLLGWSWGGAIMGSYAAEHPAKVERLVLYAPLWPLPQPPQPGAPKLGAYRTVTREAARTRWLREVPEDQKARLIPPGWFEAWADATWATDPVGAAQTPPVLRAPNGVLLDIQTWRAGQSPFDPARITAPTLIVLAEWDRDTPPAQSLALFPLLTNAPHKRLVLLGHGTHTIIMERNRMQLFNQVQLFLEEKLAQ